MGRTSIATEAFGGTLSNWTQINTFAGTIQITSGEANASHAQPPSACPAARWTGAGTFTDDQYSSVQITNLAGWASDSYHFGVIARASGDTDSNRDYYFASITGAVNGSPWECSFGKTVNGTTTDLNTANITFAEGDAIEIECEGTTIRVLVNGTALGGSFTVTDSSITTGKPGVLAGGAATTIRGDNWEGGNITAGGADLTDVSLVDIGGSAQASLTSIKWDWFDEADPKDFTAPTDQGTAETTDGSGNITIAMPNSTLTTGQTGFLVLKNEANDLIGGYRLAVD